MNSIQYMSGDATRPICSGPALVVHVCNDVGGWGAGFVLAISKRWPEPEERYRSWYRGARQDDPAFELGQVQFVEVESGITVANLIGQRGIRRVGGLPPIRYEAIEQGLGRIAANAAGAGASIHMPRIGCGLAGGTWDRIEPLIQHQLTDAGLPVTVYDLPPL